MRTTPRRRSRKRPARLYSAPRIGIILVVLVVGLALVAGLPLWGLWDKSDQPGDASNIETGLPTPIGFPETAQEVGTLVGQPAPDFTLGDETGQPVTVLPGQTERPIVLIFNMGLG